MTRNKPKKPSLWETLEQEGMACSAPVEFLTLFKMFVCHPVLMTKYNGSMK